MLKRKNRNLRLRRNGRKRRKRKGGYFNRKRSQESQNALCFSCSTRRALTSTSVNLYSSFLPPTSLEEVREAPRLEGTGRVSVCSRAFNGDTVQLTCRTRFPYSGACNRHRLSEYREACPTKLGCEVLIVKCSSEQRERVVKIISAALIARAMVPKMAEPEAGQSAQHQKTTQQK